MGRFAFSNFQPAPVTCDHGITYPTLEHAYQAMKTLDARERERIAALPTPGKAKRAGRTLNLRTDWERVKQRTMLQLLRQKFAPGTPHARALLATGSARLVEWNHWHDRTWGRCTCEACRGQGQNLLGRALMRVRAELRTTTRKGRPA